MELQDFAVKGITSQLRFVTPAPTFIDQRGHLIEALMREHELSEWGYGQDFVDAFRADGSVTLRVASRELRAMFENVESTTEVKKATKSFLGWGLDSLGVERLGYVGVRSFRIAAADSFRALNEWLLDRLMPGHAQLLQPFGSKSSDSGWVLEFHDKDPKHNLRIGPMTPEQAMAQVFRDQDTDHYPPQFLFLDVDRLYSDEEMSASEALQRWESAFDRNLEIGETLSRRLRPEP